MNAKVNKVLLRQMLLVGAGALLSRTAITEDQHALISENVDVILGLGTMLVSIIWGLVTRKTEQTKLDTATGLLKMSEGRLETMIKQRDVVITVPPASKQYVARVEKPFPDTSADASRVD